jgi:hypothetical protein
MKPWKTREWREKRRAFLKGKRCEWCGAEENLVIHHPSYLHEDGRSISDEEYLDFERAGVMVLCRRCHLQLHKGYVLCKVCGKHYHDPGYEMCFTCAVEREPRLEEYRMIEYVHPWCGRKFRIQQQWLEIEQDFLCCLEHCDEFPDCEIMIKCYEEEDRVLSERLPKEAEP